METNKILNKLDYKLDPEMFDALATSADIAIKNVRNNDQHPCPKESVKKLKILKLKYTKRADIYDDRREFL